MKKKLATLAMSGAILATPILSSITAYADQPGDPIEFTLKEDMEKSGLAMIDGEKVSWSINLTQGGVLTVVWGASKWSIDIHNTSSYVGYNHTTSGAPVYCAQVMLYLAGYNPGTIDGVFGSNTHDAIENFQRSHGLSVDSTVGPNTWNALYNAIN